jgi:hypothetical protein
VHRVSFFRILLFSRIGSIAQSPKNYLVAVRACALSKLGSPPFWLRAVLSLRSHHQEPKSPVRYGTTSQHRSYTVSAPQPPRCPTNFPPSISTHTLITRAGGGGGRGGGSRGWSSAGSNISGALSGGAIAGIVIGVVAAVAIVGSLVVMFLKRKRGQREEREEKRGGMAVYRRNEMWRDDDF